VSQPSSSNAGDLGGGLLESVEALSNEQLLWSVHASRLMPFGAEATGRLFLTTQRIVFCPIKRDPLSGPWAVDRMIVQAVSVKFPEQTISPVPERPLMHISIRDGTAEAFFVVSPKKVARRLNKALFSDQSPS